MNPIGKIIFLIGFVVFISSTLIFIPILMPGALEYADLLTFDFYSKVEFGY